MICEAIKTYRARLSRRTLQGGAIAVELAFVAVAMLLVIAGAIGFGRAYWYADALTKATRDGARFMSTWAFSASGVQLGISGGVVPAQTLTLNSANAANVTPLLTADTHIKVECLDASFTAVNCNITATKPANVRVSITNFNINVSDWFPFIGGADFGNIGLAPHTTMRYMN